MNPKESEFSEFEVPVISEKTPSDRLQEYSKLRWLSSARNHVAKDIVQNGKELLAGSDVDWDLVLRNIKTTQLDAPRAGMKSIVAIGATTIGGLAAADNRSMHDPPAVYLSARLLADRVEDSGEFEDFKSTMREAAVSYGQKTLPHTDLYNIEILYLLLNFRPKSSYRDLIERLKTLWDKGDFERVYKIIEPRDERVRKLREDSSSNITSSILTPPKPGR